MTTCSSISRHAQKMHRSFGKVSLSVQSSVCVLPEPSSGWAEEEIRRAYVNFIFENLEGQDEISSACIHSRIYVTTLAFFLGGGIEPRAIQSFLCYVTDVLIHGTLPIAILMLLPYRRPLTAATRTSHAYNGIQGCAMHPHGHVNCWSANEGACA